MSPRYISMYNLAQSSYDIIMATEIIGLSETEKEIIAGVVKYDHAYIDYDIETTPTGNLGKEVYMRVAKLSAILRIAGALDKSHKQKFNDIKAKLQDDTLVITVRTNKDITLEKGVLAGRADYFEEIFCVRPVINQIAKI